MTYPVKGHGVPIFGGPLTIHIPADPRTETQNIQPFQQSSINLLKHLHNAADKI